MRLFIILQGIILLYIFLNYIKYIYGDMPVGKTMQPIGAIDCLTKISVPVTRNFYLGCWSM